VRSSPVAGELLVGRDPAEVAAQLLGGAHDQRLELADGLGARRHRPLARRQQHAQGLACAPPAGLGQVLARERFASGAGGVEQVRLGAVAPRQPNGAIHLHHPLAALEQVRGQAGAEAAGALDRPDAPSGCPLPGEGEQPAVAEGVGGHLRLGDHASGGVADRRRVGVAVGVDADDLIDQPCQHPHGVLLVRWTSEPVPAWTRKTARAGL